MNDSSLNFTVLVERARLLACTLGLVALTACGGGGTDATDNSAADSQTGVSVSDELAGRARLPIPNPAGRTNGIVLSEKVTSGIVLSESIEPPETEEQEEE